MASETRRLQVGFYLRDCANHHYLAAIGPYLDRLLREPGVDVRLIVRALPPEFEELAEYRGYAHLVSDRLVVDDCDLVLTPSFLHADDRPGPRNARTRVVQIFHGMSDKPFTYERDFSDYALCLCAGQRQVDRLLAHPHNASIRWAKVGYPKFDGVPREPRSRPERPVLIYCPTWRKGGISSIDRVLARPDVFARLARSYELIVKPHPNVFNPRRPFYDPAIVQGLERLPAATLARTGSVMPWQGRADLFLGDISAAGYEWLYFGRPMVFLNPKPGTLRASTDAEALTYLWQCGPVCDDLDELPGLIKAALRQDRYAATRESVLHYSVHRPRDGRATERALAALRPLLEPLPLAAA